MLLIHLGCALLMLVGACGPLPPVVSTKDSADPINDTDVTPYEFPDDADPTLAELSFVETELLLQPFPGAESDDLQELYDEIGALGSEELTDVGVTKIEVTPEQLATSATLLADSELIEAVHKNYIVSVELAPDDPQYASQSHLTQIHAAEAWDTTIGDDGIRLAIVDTGVDNTHPDLAGRITEGWSVPSKNANYADVNGHGTQVAGVAAAATNNATGVAGLVWECPILAVRVANPQGTATVADIATGILWAADHGADVINVSFAPMASNSFIKNAVVQAYNKGSLVFVSAGNGGQQLAGADYAEGVYVGAVDGVDSVAVFSDRGAFVDLAAPGVGTLTTAMGGGYNAPSGTSFASPIAAGVAALAWSVNPELSNAQIRDALFESTLDLGTSGRDTSFGWGRVDAAEAVALALELEPIGDTTPPTLSISSPANGGTVSGKAQVQITAQDDVAVTQVMLSVDGAALGTDKAAPYTFVINTAKYSPGSHTLSAVATDSSGNASAPSTATVTFSGATSTGSNTQTAIQFTSPANNASVSSDVTLNAKLTDADGLASVQWKVDNAAVYSATVSGTSSSVNYRWRAAQATRGTHTISLTVTDKKGSKATATLTLVRS